MVFDNRQRREKRVVHAVRRVTSRGIPREPRRDWQAAMVTVAVATAAVDVSCTLSDANLWG